MLSLLLFNQSVIPLLTLQFPYMSIDNACVCKIC